MVQPTVHSWTREFLLLSRPTTESWLTKEHWMASLLNEIWRPSTCKKRAISRFSTCDRKLFKVNVVRLEISNFQGKRREIMKSRGTAAIHVFFKIFFSNYGFWICNVEVYNYWWLLIIFIGIQMRAFLRKVCYRFFKLSNSICHEFKPV
jgi:hypothetical protein